MKIKIALLIIIIVLFLFTRLHKIIDTPPSLYWDEASIGYNAYSILKTGKDEWGEFLPVHFRAFGEYKLPIYIYVTSLFESVVGLNELAVRLPAVVFTLFTIIIVYSLVLRITKSSLISLFSSFLFVISPWNFIFSRTGYEVTAGLMFYLLGVLLFLLEKKRKFFLILSAAAFVLSLYSYNSFRLITPITLLILFWYESDFKIKATKILEKVPFVLIFIAGLIPIVRLYLYGDGLNRLNAVGIFGEGFSIQTMSIFLLNYLKHFNPQFLFISGDINSRSQIPEFGQLFSIDSIFIILGLVAIFLYRKKEYLLVLSLLLISPIAASITKESPHALRAISMSPFLSIISALGISFLIVKVTKYKTFFITTIVFIYLLSFGTYYLNFINNYNLKASEHWQYPYKTLFINYKNITSTSKRVYISDHLSQPYIFYLFYNNYPPKDLLENMERNTPDKWGFSSVRRIGKVEFINFKEEKEFSKQSILVTPPNININGKKLEDIKFLNGEKALDVYIYE